MGVGKGIMLTTRDGDPGEGTEKQNTAVRPRPGVPAVRDQSGVSD